MSFNIPGPRVPSTNILKSLTITEKANIEEMDIKKIKITDSVKIGNVSIENGFITGLNDPVHLDGAATKKYVDEMLGPTIWKAPCRLATIILENLSLNGLLIIDGVQTVIGNRILVKNQTNGIDNGYYIVSSGIWSRTTDMPDGKKISGYTTIVQEGVDNQDTAWFCVNNEDSDTTGIDNLVFSKFSSYDIAGAGLSKSGSILNVNTDNTTIYVNVNNDLSLTDTTVTTGTYGSSTQVSSFDVNAQGRITNAQNISIQDATSLQKGLITINDQTFTGIKTFTEIHTTYLSGLSNPVGNSDATNKAYVDAVASGINWTEPVRVISVVQIDLITGGLLIIDGITLIANDRVLVTGGSTSFPNVSGSSIDNGIYLANIGSWVRSVDMPIGTAVSGYASFISQGIIYSGTGFVCSTSVPDTVGTDALRWVQFSGNSIIYAGNGLTKTGNILDVNVDGVGIEISGGNLQLKDGGVVFSKLENTSVIAGNYGSSSQIPSITIDAKGRITSASNNSFSTGGDVYGPSLSNDNAITRFDGTTGKLIQNSSAYVDDSGNISCNYLMSNVLTGTAPFTVNSTTVVTNLKSDTVVTNANLTGPITSIGNTTSINLQTGTGSTFVMQTSPALTTPNIGIASGTRLTNSIGSVSEPSYTFNGRTSTGMYSSADDTISLVAGGTQILDANSLFINLPLTRPSYSGATGALITNGGIGISNTTDALSSSNGGTFTTDGGMAVAKKLYVGFSSNATNHIDGYLSTTTSNGTTILTVNSDRQQYFTGTLTHTVRMPATSTLVPGQSYIVLNSSSGLVTIQSSGSNTILILSNNTQCTLTCISTSTTTAADWSIYVSINTLSSGNIIVGNSSGVPSSVTMSGDATVSNTGALTLESVNTSPGTTNLSSITTNAKGLVTSNITGNLSGDITSTGLVTTYGNNVPLTKGGTNASLTANNGGIFYSTASAGAILAGTATSGQIILSGASSAPSWSTTTYPITSTVNNLLYASSTNVIGSLATANNSVLVTSASGVPSLGTIITIGNGTVSAPTYSFSSSTNTGVYSSSTGVLDFSVSGTNRMSMSVAGVISIPTSTSTTSNTTGSLTLAGGIGISNSTNAQSTTNGGTITTAGGAAIAKDLFVGGILTTDIASAATTVNVGYTPTSTVLSNILNWTNSTSAIISSWKSVAWSPSLGLFVAVSNGRNIMHSFDGVTWAFYTDGAPVNAPWTSVTWSPSLSLFVAVSATDNTMRSSDGITWINSTSGVVNTSWQSVAWSPSLGLFVAISVGTANTMRSSDGITWINSTDGVTSSTWYSVAWSPSLAIFVAVAYTSVNTMRSSDGIKWINSTSGVVSANWSSVTWSPSLGLFVAISALSRNTMRSSNGIVWMNNNLGAPDGSNWSSIAWSPSLGLFVAVSTGSQNTMRSSDGFTWTNSTTGVTFASNWSSVAWSPSLGLFVTISSGSQNTMTSNKVGLNNTINTANAISNLNINGITNIVNLAETISSTTGALIVSGGVGINKDLYVKGSGVTDIASSANTVNVGYKTQVELRNAATRWISGGVAPSASNWQAIAWSPTLNLFVAISYGSNNTAYSSNGITWTSNSGAISANWQSVAWSPLNNAFVAVSQNLVSGINTMISYNGISWIGGATSIFSPLWSSVAWSPSLKMFVVIATNTTLISYSYDGVTWNISGSAPTTSNWSSLAWSTQLGLFVAVASGSNAKMYSSNGTTWTAGTAPASTAAWNSVTWSPALGLFVAIASNSIETLYSSNGIAWIAGGAAISSAPWRSIEWSEILGMFSVISYGSTATMYSTNGTIWIAGGAAPSAANWSSLAWSPSLGIFAAVSYGSTSTMYSSSVDNTKTINIGNVYTNTNIGGNAILGGNIYSNTYLLAGPYLIYRVVNGNVAAASGITISNIPQNFNNLHVILSTGGVSPATTLGLRFNGDAGSNYRYTILYSSSTSVNSFAETNTSFAGIGDVNIGVMNTVFTIPFYNRSAYKAFTANASVFNGGTYDILQNWSNSWLSISSITSMFISARNGNNLNGSPFDYSICVYGLY